jgi:hypothetical protein
VVEDVFDQAAFDRSAHSRSLHEGSGAERAAIRTSPFDGGGFDAGPSPDFGVADFVPTDLDAPAPSLRVAHAGPAGSERTWGPDTDSAFTAGFGYSESADARTASIGSWLSSTGGPNGAVPNLTDLGIAHRDEESEEQKAERARIPSWDNILMGVRRKGD